MFDFKKEPGQIAYDRDLNTKDKPLISIITPFYNSGKYFEQTFNCVVNQTFPYFEWIIVNDGSTNEGDIEILKKFVEKDKRIKLYNKENGGISSARNLGIRNSNTDIIVPLDADDLIIPTYLEYNYWALYFNPTATWSYTDCVGFQGHEYTWRKNFSPSIMKTDNLLVCTAAIRKSDIVDIGYYNDSYKHYNEDWYVWLKFLSKSKFPVHIAQYGFWYRRVDNGVLSIVMGNEETSQISRNLITDAAKNVDVSVTAKEYPIRNLPNQFDKPKLSDWERKVFTNNKKIKIMMLIPWMEMGGADLFNLDIVRKLDKTKFEVSIITTIASQNNWKQKFEEHAVDIFDLPSFLDQSNYAEFISYFIKSREIDIIFLSNSYWGYYLLPWIRMNFPNITIVDCLHADMQFWRNGGYARLSEVLNNVIDITYVTNKCTKDILIEKYSKTPDEVKVVYTGVDQEYFNPDLVELTNIREELKISENKSIVLYLCRISPEKRPFLMLEIAKEIKKRSKDICFIVVGDGNQFDEFKSKIEEYKLGDTVYCVGRQEDIRLYYKICDLSLICSIKEGLAITTFDSMQMGKPVVSADVGSQYELVNSETGRLIKCRQNEATDLDNRNFEQQEISDYVNAIEEIIYDKQKYVKMCESCKRQIDEKFSLNLTIDTFQNDFKDLVNNNQHYQQRVERSNKLQSMSNIINDYLSIYNEYESKIQECEEVWNVKEWYRRLYEETKTTNNNSINVYTMNEVEAQSKLQEIYNMRTWKLIEKYKKFMDETAVGGVLRKIRDIVFVK